MLKRFTAVNKGYSLAEILVALALLGIIVVGFLGGLASFSRTLLMTDIRQMAKNLAEAQLEYIRSLPYSIAYEPSRDINEAYPNFKIKTQDGQILGENIESRDSNIQKLTVVVQYRGKPIFSLAGYKEKPKN